LVLKMHSSGGGKFAYLHTRLLMRFMDTLLLQTSLPTAIDMMLIAWRNSHIDTEETLIAVGRSAISMIALSFVCMFKTSASVVTQSVVRALPA
jgi:hypothetical protein